MRLLLDSVVKRLSGKGGDPVIQLQTAFGGGKTHTMLAVYHLANRARAKPWPVTCTAWPPFWTAAAGDRTAARAHRGARRHQVCRPTNRSSAMDRWCPHAICTLWGDLAWQLGGAEGYALVADADASGTSPGKAVLETLLARCAPCVILIDELVAYVRQFEEGKALTGGTFDSNLSLRAGADRGAEGRADGGAAGVAA